MKYGTAVRLKRIERFLLLGLLMLLIASCANNDAGRGADWSERLKNELSKAAADGNSPSTQVAVVQGGSLLVSEGFGQQSGTDVVYMNASVQKSFTAVAVLQLVEKGLINLDEDVSHYLPFAVRHPLHPEKTITVRLLLAHRSGMGDFPHQFSWDTESSFAPRWRPRCPEALAPLSLQGFIEASLIPGQANYRETIWEIEPGTRYRYSVSAFPLLRHLVSRVSGVSYDDYLRQHIFDPLEMKDTGFSVAEFSGRHAIPHTRVDGANVILPFWDGRGHLMHTTAEDMAHYVIAFLNDGRFGDYQLLTSETVKLMRQRTSRFKTLFRKSDDLERSGHGLGTFLFRAGWFGNGGSAPGYQCLMRYNPSSNVGYVILSNVNAILSGGNNYKSARNDIYRVQNCIMANIDPAMKYRERFYEAAVVTALILWAGLMRWLAVRGKKRRNTSS